MYWTIYMTAFDELFAHISDSLYEFVVYLCVIFLS